MILTKFLKSKDWIRGLNFGIKTSVGMSNLKLFEGKQVRTYWDAKEEQWYFSVIDVVEILTNSPNPRDYWFKMKLRIKTEDGLELSTICRQLKLKAADQF